MNVILKEFKILGKKGEGTFSEVLKCQRTKDSNYFACKKMKHSYENYDQVNSLREIQAMRRLSPHPFIVQLEDVIFDQRSGSLVLVLELMDMNVYELIRGRKHYLPEGKVRSFMWQMIKGIEHMHKNGIFHRDIKPENLLIRDDRLKLADFGSCRSTKSTPPFTEYISTRWYRSPECLLTDGHYGAGMDIWSAGCVIFEVMSLRPLFPGANEVDQLAKIHDVLGTPSAEIMKTFKGKSRHISYNFTQKKGTGFDKLLAHASPECIDIIKKMLEYDPANRPSARSVVRHPYFRDFKPRGELASLIKPRIENKENKPVQAIAQASPSPYQQLISPTVDMRLSLLPKPAQDKHSTHINNIFHNPSNDILKKRQRIGQFYAANKMSGAGHFSFPSLVPHHSFPSQGGSVFLRSQQTSNIDNAQSKLNIPPTIRLRHRQGILMPKAKLPYISKQ